MAQAIKLVVGQGLLTLAGLSAARRVSSWIRIATQRGMLVVMPRDEDLEDPDSFRTEGTSALTLTPCDHARYGLRRERMGEADHPAPEVEDRPEVVARVLGAAANARVDGPSFSLP